MSDAKSGQRIWMVHAGRLSAFVVASTSEGALASFRGEMAARGHALVRGPDALMCTAVEGEVFLTVPFEDPNEALMALAPAGTISRPETGVHNVRQSVVDWLSISADPGKSVWMIHSVADQPLDAFSDAAAVAREITMLAGADRLLAGRCVELQSRSDNGSWTVTLHQKRPPQKREVGWQKTSPLSVTHRVGPDGVVVIDGDERLVSIAKGVLGLS